MRGVVVMRVHKALHASAMTRRGSGRGTARIRCVGKAPHGWPVGMEAGRVAFSPGGRQRYTRGLRRDAPRASAGGQICLRFAYRTRAQSHAAPNATPIPMAMLSADGDGLSISAFSVTTPAFTSAVAVELLMLSSSSSSSPPPLPVLLLLPLLLLLLLLLEEDEEVGGSEGGGDGGGDGDGGGGEGDGGGGD